MTFIAAWWLQGQTSHFKSESNRVEPNLTKASTQTHYLSCASTENQAVRNIDHYAQNEWVLQPNLLTQQFNSEILRKPLHTKVLKPKSPGSNSKGFAWETHGLNSPAGKIQLLGSTKGKYSYWGALRTAPPEQRSWQGWQGSGLNPKTSSPTVPGQEQRLDDSNLEQPQSTMLESGLRPRQ